MDEQHPDQGFSLIEVLLVILVLGLLSAVVVTSVGGARADADRSACAADAQRLAIAAEAFFAQRRADSIPAADASADGHERTLAEEGFLRAPSTLHDLDASGTVAPAAGSPCPPL